MSAVPPSILHVVEMDQWFTGVGARGLTVALMGHLLKYGVTAEKLFPHRPAGLSQCIILSEQAVGEFSSLEMKRVEEKREGYAIMFTEKLDSARPMLYVSIIISILTE